MTKLYSSRVLQALYCCLILTAALLSPTVLQAQLYAPEGLHMPGTWNGYQNQPDPATNFAIRGTTSNNCGTGNNACAAGGINKVASAFNGPGVFQTTLKVAASGGDFVAGSYAFAFASGPGNGGFWNNTWKGVNVTDNTLQNYSYQSGGDNNITIANGNWYTMNWVDNGYGSTKGIFMATSAAPVSITTASQSPAAGSVSPTDPVVVSLTLSVAKSAEEIVYVRYSTDNFATSSLVTATGAGTAYSATIPAQANGTSVNYYAFTSTVSAALITGDYDAYAIRYKNNAGAVYSYTSTNLPPVSITFRVDMANEIITGPISVAGTFNGYSSSANVLTQEGATTIYSTSISLAQNSNIQYKFVKNGTFEDNIATPCGNGSNRTYTVPNANSTVTVSCFSKCGACPPTHPVTFQVDMQNEAAVTAVYVSGEFNNYNTTASPLTNVSGTLWTTTLNLEEGRSYSYKFVRNSGDYENNIPSGACNPGGAGGNNRAYSVTTAATQTIPVACFNTCGACAALSAVTLSVDMRDQNVTSGVSVSGTFNGYNTSANPMNKVGTTSVYTVTLTLPEAANIQYKFVNGIGTNSYEGNLGAPCGSGNRTYTVPTNNSTIATVCYGSCVACAPKYNVTFTVNMAGQTVTGPVALVGDFNGFNPATNPMTNIGGTVYQTTVSITAGSHIYKFYNTGGPNSGYEGNIGAPCGDGSNRTYTVSSTASVPVMCYNSCIDCGATNTWTGAANTSFTNGANWTAGSAPSGCSANIQINAAANQPAIAAATTVSVGDVAVMSGATLSLGVGSVLNSCGNLSGAGTIAGNLTLNGTGAQTITGGLTVSDFAVNKTSGSTALSGTLRVGGTVTLSNATSGMSTIGQGALVLVSNATGTGRVATIPAGATFNVNLTQQRYIAGSTPGWYFVGMPVNSTLADWNEANVRVSPKNNTNLFEYTEPDTTQGTYNGRLTEFAGWKVPGSLSNSAGPAKGYRIYPAAGFFAGGATLAVTGQPNQGTIAIPYSKTGTGYEGGGWNLLSNPYPSELDWNAVVNDPSNTGGTQGNAISIYQGATSNYGSYTATGPTTGISVGNVTRFVASSQSFFIKASGNGSLTFKEAHKSSAAGNSFTRQGAEGSVLKITVAQNQMTDQAAVAFLNEVQYNDARYDAVNPFGSSADVAIAGKAIEVNGPLDGMHVYNVSVTVPAAGTTTLSFAGADSFEPGTMLVLRDELLGTSTDLTMNPTLNVNMTSPTDNSRFKLLIASSSVTATMGKVTAKPNMNVYPNPATGRELTVTLSNFGGRTAQLQLVDGLGRTIMARTVTLSDAGTTALNVQDIASGMYTLKATGTAATTAQQVIIK